MKDQEAIEAIVKECINTWPATVKKAAAAGYSFCLIGYFEIPDDEHSSFHPVLAPLLEDIECKGAQALEFRPHMDGVYDKTGRTVVAFAQGPWLVRAEWAADKAKAKKVQLLSNDYTRTRDVTVRVDPKQKIRGIAYPKSKVPTFRTTQPSERIIGAVGVSWHEPRLK